MKYYLYVSVILLFNVQMAQCQVSEPISKSQESSHEYYSFKQAQNKRAARFCLATGSGLIIVGGIVAFAGIANSESPATPIGVGMFFLGSLTTFASIPLYIAAGHNRRKAMLSLKSEPITFGIKPKGNSNYTSLGVSITF
jgi:hypothetical protein